MKTLLTWKNANGRITIELDLTQFFLYWGIFTSAFLFLTSSLSCIFTFNCSEFLPTFSYLGAYSCYDRALVWIASAQTVPLMFFFTSTFEVYYKHTHWLVSYTLIVLGFALSVVLPSVFIFDEVNTSYYFPLNRLHLILLSAVLLALGIWMGFSLLWLYKINKKRPQKAILWTSLYVISCFCSVFITIDKWTNSNKPGFYTKLALSEYLSTALLVFLPRVYLSALSNLKFSIGQGKLIKTDN